MNSVETDGGWCPVEVIEKNGILYADDMGLGVIQLDLYHDNLTKIKWKQDDA